MISSTRAYPQITRGGLSEDRRYLRENIQRAERRDGRREVVGGAIGGKCHAYLGASDITYRPFGSRVGGMLKLAGLRASEGLRDVPKPS